MVLEETTPWEHWYELYSKEHYGRKPLMRDCYITHGWNKQAKTPIWLPRDVRNTGTLRSVFDKWFSSSKDKVTIIFEFINKDRAQLDTGVSEQLQNLSFEITDHELSELVCTNSSSPSSEHQSLPTYELHSSPPSLTTGTVVPDNDIPYPPSESVLISSFHSEFPSIQQLIGITSAGPDPPQTRTSITLALPTNNLPSSPLSTIPDSPEIPSAPQSIPHTLSRITQIPSRSTSKVLHSSLISFNNPY